MTAKLGEGGMGEVYRAHDTKLGRDVAIKVLPAEMSRDPERLARFDREARTLATLQHANIASIYGFESAGETRFLVMELVEGEDLSELMRRGAMPEQEVVDLAQQLAEGLTAAHAVGVIHRDLKPANIKITDEGQLKILDFGLARAFAGEDGYDSDLEHSPTITAMTQAGVILGTAAYMSPEQARGKRVDHRADIWAFGVVVYEMLTGRRVFDGETVSDTLAGVLRAELLWDQLPSDTSPALRRLLERCLDRDASRRLQAIAEARIGLEDLEAGRTDPVPPPKAAGQGPDPGRGRWAWIGIVAVLLAVIVGLVLSPKEVVERPLVQTTIMPPDGWDFAPASPFAVSPDGRQIAFVAFARPENEEEAAGSNSIWIRDLAETQARRLAGADGDAFPFWSPEGRWLGYFAEGKLNKIEARGGPVIPLCDATDGRGGTWNEEGVIVFQRAWSEGLMKIESGGGTPEPVTTLDRERLDVAHRWPSFLPDGRHFLFYVANTSNPLASELSGIYVGSLDSAEVRMLMSSESRALYARGHLVYRSGSTLMARPFEPSRLEFTGDPVPLATDIPGGAISWGGAQFGISEADVLVHMRGTGAALTLLNWRDRAGELLEAAAEPAGHWEPRLSHDGTRVAVAIGQDVADIWILELASGMRTRFTFDPVDDRTPLWSPDDGQLAFSSGRSAAGEIYVRPISGQGEAKLLHAADAQVELTDWSSDGRLIFFNLINPRAGGSDVWTVDVETGEAEVLLTGDWFEDARLSPDGKWLAFVSQESGRSEIHVQSFPDAAGRWMVSSDAGAGIVSLPSWRSDGRELFYLRGGAVVAVSVQGADTFSFGSPETLFNVSVTTSNADYAVSADGQRILTNELPPADQSEIGATLIQSWTSLLSR